jgi:asparagine synthase (glutamine-hydrolysing)
VHVIAAVWTPWNSSQADEVFDRMARVVRSNPTRVSATAGAKVAAWSLARPGRICSQTGAAWVGTLSSLPRQIDLRNASELTGEYALVAPTPDGLILGRGRHAGMCLFHASLADGGIVACSRLEPLLACTERGAPNVEALASLLMIEEPDDPSATVYRRVQRVAPTETVHLGASGPRVWKRAGATRAFTGPVDDLAAELRDRIRGAVGRSLGEVDKAAVLVSGGLDSSVVLADAVACVREQKSLEILPISVSFAGPGDDRPHLTALCRALDVAPLRLRPKDAANDILAALVADAAPMIWPTASWEWAASRRATGEGAKIVLTGQGGDQIFGGDLRVFARTAWSTELPGAIAQLSKLYRTQRNLSFQTIFKSLVGPPLYSFIPALAKGRRHRYLARRWPWAGKRLNQSIFELASRRPDSEWATTDGEVKFRRLVARDFVRIAETRGQIEAETNLAHAHPFLDDDVVEFVAGLAQTASFLGGQDRGLLRASARGILPESLRMRPDKARFEPAIAELIAASDLVALRELSNMQMSADLGLVEPTHYQRHFESALRDGPHCTEWPQIWPALAVEAFLRKQWPRSG